MDLILDNFPLFHWQIHSLITRKKRRVFLVFPSLFVYHFSVLRVGFSHKKNLWLRWEKHPWLGLIMFWLARSRMEMVSNFLWKIAIDKKKNNILRRPYKYASTAATRTAGGNLAALSAVMTPPPSPSTSRCESQLSSTYSNVNPVFLNMSTPDLSGVNIYC